ncbi:MAG: flagellar basal-body MS-ring/collar protein FliF, partial [bacterium]
MLHQSPMLSRVKVLWERIPSHRRIQFLFFTAAGIAITLIIILWALRPSYQTLFYDLSWSEAAEVNQILDQEGIPYRLQDEGRRILVPSSQVYKARMKLAAKGLPRQPGVGWEIFDRTNLGVTDFVQKLNFRRSLEGELARTIIQLDPVEAARVHLVIPEETIFRENRREPTASVTLRLKRGMRLTSDQIEGISYLLSSAVEGLIPENVTVLDSRGTVLSEKKKIDPLARLTSSQLELQEAVEQSLRDKGQTLLDKRFGPGRSAIQVTAQLDFTQYEKSSEIYDPDNPAIRSEETSTSSQQRGDTSSSRQETQVTNYELSLTRERVVSAIGQLKRLSIAVMVDGKYQEIPEGKKIRREFTPLTPKELGEIEQTIAAALGFNPERGDEISVVSVPFQDLEMMEEEPVTFWRWENILPYLPRIGSLIGVVILILILRGLFKRAIQVVEEGVKLPSYPPTPEHAPSALRGVPEPSLLPPGAPPAEPH